MGNYIYSGLKFFLCEYVNKQENVWKRMIKMMDHGIWGGWVMKEKISKNNMGVRLADWKFQIVIQLLESGV